MIDKTDCTVLTEFAKTILDILAQDERADNYELLRYLPELKHTYNGQEWTVFQAYDLVKDKPGFVLYSDEDGFGFTSMRSIKRRMSA